MKVVLHIQFDVTTEADGIALKENILSNLPYASVSVHVPEPDPDPTILPDPIHEPPQGN